MLCTVGVHSECAVTEYWRDNDIREYFKAGEQPLGGMIDMSEAVTDYSLRIKDTGTILSLRQALLLQNHSINIPINFSFKTHELSFS